MSNEHIDWIEKSICDEHINFYKYSDFKLIRPIGHGSSGNVVCTSWKHTNCILVLKSFNNEQITLKEVVNKVLIYKLFNISYKVTKTKPNFYR